MKRKPITIRIENENLDEAIADAITAMAPYTVLLTRTTDAAHAEPVECQISDSEFRPTTAIIVTRHPDAPDGSLVVPVYAIKRIVVP